MRGECGARFDRLYAPDPNQGLWDAFRAGLGLSPERRCPRVTFLADEAAVVDAVIADPRGIGITSTLSLPDTRFSAMAVQPDRRRGGATRLREDRLR